MHNTGLLRHFCRSQGDCSFASENRAEGRIYFATQQLNHRIAASICVWPGLPFPPSDRAYSACTYLSVLHQVVELDQVGVAPRAELLRVDVLFRSPGEVVHVVADARELLFSDLETKNFRVTIQLVQNLQLTSM